MIVPVHECGSGSIAAAILVLIFCHAHCIFDAKKNSAVGRFRTSINRPTAFSYRGLHTLLHENNNVAFSLHVYQ